MGKLYLINDDVPGGKMLNQNFGAAKVGPIRGLYSAARSIK